jgi:predicted amidohydrolase
MKVAAVQLCADLGDVAGNIARSERMVEEAFGKGARWVILPEFFTSSVGFHPVMEHAALPLEGPALEMLRRTALRHRGHVGGSFIVTRGADRFNTFVLVRPDGSYATHDKDIPTLWENCYYRGGFDDGVVDTEIGRVGIAVCWEFIRNRTARRLLDRVEFLVGGTCWAGGSRNKLFRLLFPRWDEQNAQMIFQAPARMARMLGVPVVHASQAGRLDARVPLLGLRYATRFLGETQIVDASGRVLARMQAADGEGLITADIEPGRVAPSLPIGNDFWTAPLPTGMSTMWHLLNAHGRLHYRRMQKQRAHVETATAAVS